MNFLTGLQNFLQFIENNWTVILVIIGLIISIGKKIKDYMEKSDEEKIALALSTINETMLKFVTAAENDFEAWNGAGSIKRAQVIDELYRNYPILSKAIDQQKVIAMIDEAIDNALPTLRKVIKENIKEG